MIQEPLMNLLNNEIEGLTWYMNYHPAVDNTATIYYDGGSKPDIYEAKIRYPQYQIYIRSSDFNRALNAAQRTYDLLQGLGHIDLDVPIYAGDQSEEPFTFEKYHVYLIEALSEPIRVGVNNDIMEYSINVQATVRKI